jgi:hypothetical protein
MHDVLPPYRVVARPGTGIEPRTLQNLTFVGWLRLGAYATIAPRVGRG